MEKTGIKTEKMFEIKPKIELEAFEPSFDKESIIEHKANDESEDVE